MAASVAGAHDIRFVYMDERWLGTLDEPTVQREADGTVRAQVALYFRAPYPVNEQAVVDYTLSDMRFDCRTPGRTQTLTRLAFRIGEDRPMRLQEPEEAVWLTAAGDSPNHAWWLGACQKAGTLQAVPGHTHDAMVLHYRSPDEPTVNASPDGGSAGGKP